MGVGSSVGVAGIGVGVAGMTVAVGRTTVSVGTVLLMVLSVVSPGDPHAIIPEITDSIIVTINIFFPVYAILVILRVFVYL